MTVKNRCSLNYPWVIYDLTYHMMKIKGKNAFIAGHL
jgi:hypothetical protein